MWFRRWVPVTAVALALAALAWGESPPGAKPGSRPSDVQLVERLMAARREYQVTLEKLRAYYIATGDVQRARWAEEELLAFHRIPKQPFRLELVVPPPTLDGKYNIPEANELFRRAQTFQNKGWGDAYVDNQRRAELLYQQILSNYPQSDKISDVAYQLGDIYESRAYRQYAHAALYFQRCYQWNPKTSFDARIRAARLYERYLNERNKAIEIYKEVLGHETDAARIEEAQRRLTALSGGR